MSILRSHHCGHIQYKCPRCQSLGCGNSRCVESIGNNSSMTCKVCGSTDVLPMERYQSQMQARARKEADRVREQETRMRNLEKATHTTYIGGYEGSVYSGESFNIFKLINLKTLIVLGSCYGLSIVLKHDEFEGIPAFLIGVINVIGAFTALLILIFQKLLDYFLTSL
jgi:hypothetical protein